jgi:3D (Asp-Asp-Asp) domain-containing protein
MIWNPFRRFPDLKEFDSLSDVANRAMPELRRRWLVVAGAFFLPILVGLVLSAFRPTGETKQVTILADGNAYHLQTTQNFVSEVLSRAGIDYDEDDIIMPPAMATILDGEVITVRRVERRRATRDTLMPFETRILANKRLRVGSEVELRAGVPGLTREVVEIESMDGRVVSEEVLSSEVVLTPVDRKVYRGTLTTGSTIANLRMQATAYTAGAESCWPFVDGRTAVLKKAGYGVAAVDPRVIRLGTRLYIDGYGFAIASDVGGAIKGQKIDLFMSDVQTARRFGRRTVNVYLLD